MYLVYDTETTGLIDFSQGFQGKNQPKLVQLAAILFTDQHEEIASLSTIIQPEGWTIPEAASNVHGITTEDAIEKGVYLGTALELFADFTSIADTVVAHNMSYDSLVMRHQAYFKGFQGDIFNGCKMHCTKDASTPILKIPKAKGSGFKWPKLEEAVWYFYQQKIEGAHNALVDTRWCAKVYQKLVAMGAYRD